MDGARRRAAGAVLLLLMVGAVGITYGQFRGAFTPTTQLRLHADRAGLVMDPGAKVTLNGVDIGRVSAVDAVDVEGNTMAQLTLAVVPRYARIVPSNARVDITATTVFGNKYVSFTSPEDPSPQPISPTEVIRVSAVTTEFNTLFETIMSIAEQVDPVRLNTTLSALADALTGQRSPWPQTWASANQAFDAVIPRLPQLRYDTVRLAELADVYTASGPQLWDALADAATTAGSVHRLRGALDAALLASIGFGSTAADVFDHTAPYLLRSAADLVSTSTVLDRHSPSLFCTIRNYAQVAPRVAGALGSNGYSLSSVSGGGVNGAEPPYIYPDNLPRINAQGGPGGRPGCWQSITRELWPAPYLVVDTGASIAPYNHLELGQPMFVDYVWGRQVGEYTINP